MHIYGLFLFRKEISYCNSEIKIAISIRFITNTCRQNNIITTPHLVRIFTSHRINNDETRYEVMLVLSHSNGVICHSGCPSEELGPFFVVLSQIVPINVLLYPGRKFDQAFVQTIYFLRPSQFFWTKSCPSQIVGTQLRPSENSSCKVAMSQWIKWWKLVSQWKNFLFARFLWDRMY